MHHRGDALDLYLEVGGERRIDVCLQHAATEAHHAVYARVRRMVVREGVGPDEREALIAAVPRPLVGVDRRQVDAIVLRSLEVGDNVALRSAGLALCNGIEVETINIAASDQSILAAATYQQIVSVTPNKNVVSAVPKYGIASVERV